jgi:DNA-binding NarL/FixJ family response regulator
VKAAWLLKPDIIILDITMPRLNGLDAGEQIKQKLPAVKLVYLTMNAAADVAAEAFRRGASGYVLKHSAAEELVIAIRKVVQGDSYLSPLIARETVTFLLNQGKSRTEEKHITKRQSEILQLLAEGMSMKEVASVLELKPGTVAFHKYRMMEALGVKSNAELLQYAIKRQMTSS